jgi:hypothetical protein
LPGCAHAAPAIEAAAIIVATTIVGRMMWNLAIDLHSGEYRPFQRANDGFVSRTEGRARPNREQMMGKRVRWRV